MGNDTFIAGNQCKDFFKHTKFTHDAILTHMQSLRKGKTVKEKNAENQYQILEKYCQNITEQARKENLIRLLADMKKFDV